MSEQMDYKVARMFRLENGSAVKAFVDIAVNDQILIRDLRIIDGKKGLFVSLPRSQGKDGRWYDSVRILDKDSRTRIANAVLEEYRQGSIGKP
ncbi:MAG: septation protein SpoVG family protein [Candidatus Omnitrophota bacterium]